MVTDVCEEGGRTILIKRETKSSTRDKEAKHAQTENPWRGPGEARLVSERGVDSLVVLV